MGTLDLLLHRVAVKMSLTFLLIRKGPLAGNCFLLLTGGLHSGLKRYYIIHAFAISVVDYFIDNNSKKEPG